MMIRSARSSSDFRRSPSALRAATFVWMGAFSALVAGTFVLGQAGILAQAASQPTGSLEGMIASRTGVQIGTVLGEVKSMTGRSLAGYLGQRGTAGLLKSLGFQKTRFERLCQRGTMATQECVERLREVVQQQREVARLERMIQQGGEDAPKAKIRLGAAVYFQQVREEIMPDYARANRKVFTVKKSNRTPASADGVTGGGDPASATRGQFEALGRSISEFSRGALGAGGEFATQIENVEQSLRDFAR